MLSTVLHAQRSIHFCVYTIYSCVISDAALARTLSHDSGFGIVPLAETHVLLILEMLSILQAEPENR